MSKVERILTYIAIINTLTLIGVAIFQAIQIVLLRQIAGAP